VHFKLFLKPVLSEEIFKWSQKIKIKEGCVKTGVDNFDNREGLHTLLVCQTKCVRIHQIKSEKCPFIFA
jgi:hypothetical protein